MKIKVEMDFDLGLAREQRDYCINEAANRHGDEETILDGIVNLYDFLIDVALGSLKPGPDPTTPMEKRLEGMGEHRDGLEWGTFSLAELEEARGPAGLRIERDLYFEPRRVSMIPEARDGIRV